MLSVWSVSLCNWICMIMGYFIRLVFNHFNFYDFSDRVLKGSIWEHFLWLSFDHVKELVHSESQVYTASSAIFPIQISLSHELISSSLFLIIHTEVVNLPMHLSWVQVGNGYGAICWDTDQVTSIFLILQVQDLLLDRCLSQSFWFSTWIISNEEWSDWRLVMRVNQDYRKDIDFSLLEHGYDEDSTIVCTYNQTWVI
jgi:hypothetical protein